MKARNILLAGALLSSATITAQTTVGKENLEVSKAPIEKVDRTPVVFTQQENGFVLAGILYRPRTWKQGERLKAIIVGGPMYSVKEQTQSLYAQLLAEAAMPRWFSTIVISVQARDIRVVMKTRR